ncbi:hypothetical protein M3650_28390 [Paenibacillus sp. MER TA 81-3]|uniref:hypothetical protein n=1 Tax=Paenibacillus sp. MER TA 81-3 TaxID=2939573 RepID=UPI00203C5903|nr:hypothetical protein [Paenibacillus sp. MER TA 81-3]MCM3342438.1 hypothetical protein [Paenibacillus sp. MER TA 81-3]
MAERDHPKINIKRQSLLWLSPNDKSVEEAACFIYDESNYVKPLLQSVILLILVVIIDLIKRNKKKRKNPKFPYIDVSNG